MKKLGFTDRYPSGHESIHSTGSFNMTALEESTKDPDYAHRYNGMDISLYPSERKMVVHQ